MKFIKTVCNTNIVNFMCQVIQLIFDGCLNFNILDYINTLLLKIKKITLNFIILLIIYKSNELYILY